LTSPTSTAKHGTFCVASRLFTIIYGRFPLFGRLRGAIAIAHNSGQVLVIDRNDGRGWCFPGGRAWPGEPAEATVRREVREETGLTVTSCRFLFAFDEPIARTHVFEIQAAGELKGSWEGEPRWATISELSAKIYPRHRPVLAYLQESSPRRALAGQPRAGRTGTLAPADRCATFRPALLAKKNHSICADLPKAHVLFIDDHFDGSETWSRLRRCSPSSDTEEI